MEERSRGIFIVLDGIDGCGKTFHSKILTDELQTRGFDAVYTAEPSNGTVGKFIQSILLADKLLPEIEALLFAADRFEHLKRVILPNLMKGAVVVCDRFLYSSLAYQGAQGVDTNWIRMINNFAPKPDIAFYLDVVPSVGLGRIKRKRTVLENLPLQEKVRQRYLQLVQTGELVLVNSSRHVEDVKTDLIKLTIKELERLRSNKIH
jgi:dTMP kinase